MLDQKVFTEKTDLTVMDKSWLKVVLLIVLVVLGVMLFIKYKTCDDLKAKYDQDGDDEANC